MEKLGKRARTPNGKCRAKRAKATTPSLLACDSAERLSATLRQTHPLRSCHCCEHSIISDSISFSIARCCCSKRKLSDGTFQNGFLTALYEKKGKNQGTSSFFHS